MKIPSWSTRGGFDIHVVNAAKKKKKKRKMISGL